MFLFANIPHLPVIYLVYNFYCWFDNVSFGENVIRRQWPWTPTPLGTDPLFNSHTEVC